MFRRALKRIRFKLRWWKWFLVDDPFTVKWYTSAYRIDKRSRDLILDRHDAKEPKWEDYP